MDDDDFDDDVLDDDDLDDDDLDDDALDDDAEATAPADTDEDKVKRKRTKSLVATLRVQDQGGAGILSQNPISPTEDVREYKVMGTRHRVKGKTYKVKSTR